MKKYFGATFWKKISCVYLFLPLIFSFHVANGQQADLNFINLNNKDGLSSTTVNAILKDRFGYMWFATDDGLNKFDGANFTIFRHSVSDSTTIGSNVILALFEDNVGNLWIGTSLGLTLYNREKDAFINYEFMANNAVRTLCEDHLGNLWVGGYSGLYQFNPRNGKIKNYRFAPLGVGVCKLLSNTVLCIFEDSRRRLWIGTNAGLNLYLNGSDNFISYQHSDSIPNSIANNIVRTITEDSTGNIWFGTDNGLCKLRGDEKGFSNFSYKSKDVNLLSSGRIYAIRADKNGQLWIGTEEGLNIFTPESAKSQRIKSDERNKYSLVGKSVRSIFMDRNGIYWIGTINGGINKYDKNLAFFNLRESNALDPFGLSAPFVTSFAEGPLGDIYIGTDGGGLNLYHRQSGLFDHPKLITGDENKKLPILGMERVGTELWIGTYQQGLYVLNMITGSVKHYVEGNRHNDLCSNEIFCLKKDSKGNVWIGTNGKGINMYDFRTGKFYCPGKTALAGSGGLLVNGYIRALEEDREGNIWIGSSGGGISVYNPSLKTFRILNHENNDLPSNMVLSLCLDRIGNMWAGSAGGGLSLFDSKTQKFISFSEQQGLSNAFIYKILEDNSGQLWVSTNKGISSFDTRNHRFANYSYQNGLQRSTFSLGAGLYTSNGEMFFGGLDGFNYFNPLALHSNKNLPTLQLTALKIFNRTVIPGKDEAIKVNVSFAKEIRLDYKQNFSIDFIALNYTAPQESRYAYKLEGFDNGWNFVGKSHTAAYTNLDPGEYTFRVKATSEDGAWSTAEKTIKIFVKPPFWRTGYAYALYIALFTFVLALMRRMGIRKLKNKFAIEQERAQVKQMIEQERKEAERKHEFDQMKIKFLTNLSHELKTPVSLIVGPIDKLISQEGSNEKRNQLSMVKRNGNRILNLVNQLLDFRRLEENELNLNLSCGDIISFIRDIAESFKDISDAKHINFNFSSSISHFYTGFDRDKMERVLFNLLSNAFKFTGNEGKIDIRIEKPDESNLKILISDSGIGISKEGQEKIFDRFFQVNEAGNHLNQGSGIGLSIAKEFVKLHGGTIGVESIPGNGSIFTVVLPCEAIPESKVVPELLSSGHNDNLQVSTIKQKNGVQPNLTVLLIEDNDDFRLYLKNNLKPYYKIVEASDGKEGWQKILSSHPQVVVSDINMPYMDGITLSRKIKSDKRTSHIPVILLTAISGDANQLRGLLTGACDYLTKPFNFEILNVKIKNLVVLNQSLKDTYSRQLKVIPSENEVQSEDEKLLAKITQYIELNIDSPDLTVEVLSKNLFMSRGTLYSKIVDLTGETPVEFIRSIRLKKGAFLLEKSDMKIAQIGYAIGFSSPNYFAKAFKAKFNLSPSEYAEQKKGLTNSENISVSPL